MTENILLKLPDLDDIYAAKRHIPEHFEPDLSSVAAVIFARINLLDEQMKHINQLFNEVNLNMAAGDERVKHEAKNFTMPDISFESGESVNYYSKKEIDFLFSRVKELEKRLDYIGANILQIVKDTILSKLIDNTP